MLSFLAFLRKEEFMAAVSARAAAPSRTLLGLDPLGNFQNLIVKGKYTEAEKLLSSSELCHIIRSGNNSHQFLEELLENGRFLNIIELVKMFAKYGLSNKYGELCQVIAMTYLGDPDGYFTLEEFLSNPDYLTYVESITMGYENDAEKAGLFAFFNNLSADIDFIQKNPLLFAILKQLQIGALKIADISTFVKTEGAKEALQKCIELFTSFMEPHQIGGLCQRLTNEISYFQTHSTLIPKKDPSESDQKI